MEFQKENSVQHYEYRPFLLSSYEWEIWVANNQILSHDETYTKLVPSKSIELPLSMSLKLLKELDINIIFLVLCKSNQENKRKNFEKKQKDSNIIDIYTHKFMLQYCRDDLTDAIKFYRRKFLLWEWERNDEKTKKEERERERERERMRERERSKTWEKKEDEQSES